ncbi:MAG: sugar ABC transporter substrate-binding protein, partial [Chloroflexota bacterium]|nr:sugar ABC transporter substrate-binding protein [Chloroflexota bacterium]
PAGQVAFMVTGDAAEAAAYETLVAAFARAQPAARVELRHVPGQNEFRTRLVSDLAAGAPADVVLLNYRRYAEFAAGNAFVPVDRFLARSSVLRAADFYPDALRPFYWDGALVGVPQNLSSLVVYFNKSLFDRAGVAHPKDDWTWEGFLAAAVALTRAAERDGGVDSYGLGTEATLYRAAPFVWQNGGELATGANRPNGLALGHPAALDAIQWFVDLQVKHRVVPDAAAEQAERSEQRFLNGRTAMFLNSRRGVPTYRGVPSLDWDVAALPRGKRRAGILHADAYFLTAMSRSKDVAWALVEYANSVAGQAVVAATGRTVPSLKTVSRSDAFLDPTTRPRNSKAFLEAIPHLRAVPVMERWNDIEAILDEEIARAFYGRASTAEVIVAAERRSSQLFHL